MKSHPFIVTALIFIPLTASGQDLPACAGVPPNHAAEQQQPESGVAIAVQAHPHQDSKKSVAAPTPLEIVNRRMSAYNAHDLVAFLDLYSDDIEIFKYPGRSLGKGKKHVRRIFASMFQEGVVQVEIHHQIAKDGYVVNHETVKNGDKKTEYVSIYEVRDGLIQSVRFVRD